MSTGPKVLVTGAEIDDRLLKGLRGAGCHIVRPRTDPLKYEELSELIQDADAYLHGGEEYASRSLLAQAKSLKIIAFLGVGYETFIDTAAALELGKIVTNTPAAYHSVAEFTIAQIINTNRRITDLLQSYGMTGAERVRLARGTHNLVDQRIGIVGLGTIGTRIAEILHFGFHVKKIYYYSRTRKRDVEERLGIRYRRKLVDLAACSDILVVMVPGNESTKNLINDAVLRRMPKDAILINTARPSVVDPAALRDALRERRLAMAAFDGFYPKDDHNLLEEFGTRYGDGRLLYTPHVATYTQEAIQHMTEQAVGSILNVLNGRPDEHIVIGPRPLPAVPEPRRPFARTALSGSIQLVRRLLVPRSRRAASSATLPDPSAARP